MIHDEHSFDERLTARRNTDMNFTLPIPGGWEQGRAVFGGLLLGAMVRSMATVLGKPSRRLRSLSAELMGSPVQGDAEIQVRLLRAGNAVTTLCAEMLQGGSVLTHAVGMFGDPRPVTQHFQTVQPPPAPPWQDIEPLDMNVDFAPKFTKHFEYRPIAGFPFSGATEGTTSGYIKPRTKTELHDDALVVAMADAWWLATLVRLESPRPAATVAFSLDLHHEIPNLAEAPLLHRGSVLALDEGYASESRELWTCTGQLIAVNRQLVAVIK